MEDQLRKMESLIQGIVESILTDIQEFKLQVEGRFVELERKMEAFMAIIDTKFIAFLQVFNRENNNLMGETQPVKEPPITPYSDSKGKMKRLI